MLNVSGGMHPDLNVQAKLWLTFKSKFNANIILDVIHAIFALDLNLKETHSFAPMFNPGCFRP